MPSKTFHSSAVLSDQPRTEIRTRMLITILCMALVSITLAACGTSTTATESTPSPAPTSTAISTPQPSPTPVPSPKPTQVPTPMIARASIPAPTPIPAQGAPAILDLRPASMSILGHRDCQKNGAFICLARVLSGPGNQSNLHWSAFTNVPGNIAFSPSSGVLTPGQSVLVTITLPLNACTPGLFFFRGPVNTHTITWMC